MKHGALLDELSAAHTLSGHDIYRRETNRENHLRSRIAELSWEVVTFLGRQDIPDRVLRETIERLRAAYSNPAHYGDNRPGTFFQDGTPTVDDPWFDYFDFIGFALSGEDGPTGFQKLVGLDQRITYRILLAVIALLLIDSATARLDRGDAIGGAAEMLHAADAREEAFNGTRSDRRPKWNEFARLGGLARHKGTDQYKAEVLRRWDAGEFKTQVGASKWATKTMKWPVNPRVVERWIREHQRTKGHSAS